ncbi:MAG: 4-hydroxy-tetrahydrodipicolinate synthase [Gemmatimonadaceae bacterium]|nr:4-hydroxy-tetrahydrodipicolinate synthase [Gemmatimonadaceae bacterium]NUQ94137.1 4-hydroxy-tetrahydrodipicolinate synthase [Gemmatimonadaceae bacterium]NUR19391.1 4-hydroxy-tetrahydrodipicolinate synthase [Gemmatimonadaceae bacterium]NUS98904.1 4-hydroxy-tetrahydrodipicolinate synthase [Gemmatimonadaceae bacterium]
MGCGTALVTPFTRDGSLDEAALRALVDWQIAEGIHFLVPCGSTGEAATMTPAEHRRVVEIVVEQARKRVPVVAGAGSNDTRKAIEMSREMKAAGADMLLHVSPMYNKPPQRGIIAHFHAIADATDLPIIVYNVPGRTGSNIEAKTTLELAKHERIVAVKEASGNLGQIMEIIREAPDGFEVLSGDDSLTLAVMAAGGTGIVSVVSNMAPRRMSALAEACAAGRSEGARTEHTRLMPLMSAAFIESNPIPAKAAMAMMGKMQNVVRLPLVPMDARHEPVLRAALQSAGALR